MDSRLEMTPATVLNVKIEPSILKTTFPASPLSIPISKVNESISPSKQKSPTQRTSPLLSKPVSPIKKKLVTVIKRSGIVKQVEKPIKEIVKKRKSSFSTAIYNHHPEMSLNDYKSLQSLLNALQKHPSSWAFRKPVDIKDAPDYYAIIKTPMDLQTIQEKLNCYAAPLECFMDIILLFQNCFTYNPPHHCVNEAGTSS